MGSHSTLYVLTVPHISECCPEDGLIRPKHVATKIFINSRVFTVTLKYFVLLFEDWGLRERLTVSHHTRLDQYTFKKLMIIVAASCQNLLEHISLVTLPKK